MISFYEFQFSWSRINFFKKIRFPIKNLKHAFHLTNLRVLSPDSIRSFFHDPFLSFKLIFLYRLLVADNLSSKYIKKPNIFLVLYTKLSTLVSINYLLHWQSVQAEHYDTYNQYYAYRIQPKLLAEKYWLLFVR